SGLAAASSPAADSAGRIRMRFDAGWRFRRDPEARGAAGDGAYRWSWRPAEVASLNLPKLPADLERGDWQPATVGQDVFHGRRGFAWFRADMGADPKGAERVLHFEGVDDNAAVYLNGTRLAQHEGWDEPFDVPV